MALQFVAIEKSADGKTCRWLVPEETRAFLKTQKKLRIACVVGNYREGKSYIAGRLVNDISQFATSDSVKAKTRGLHLSTKYVQGTNILVMDTEGLNSPDSTLTLDTQIMALAVLFSSKVIYNCKHAIGANILDGLQCAIETARWLQHSSSENSTEEQEMSKPHLLWLLRDFTLDLRNDENKPVSPNQYLEASLGKSSVLRDSFGSLFAVRKCITLPPPALDKTDLKEMTNLVPGFENSVQTVIQDVKSCPVKLIAGQEMTGPILLSMAETMCELLSAGQAPQLQTVWENVRATQLVQVRTECLESFKLGLTKTANLVPSLSAWPLTTIVEEIVKMMLVWDKKALSRLSVDSNAFLLECLRTVERVSLERLTQWKSHVEKEMPEVDHLMPEPVQAVVASHAKAFLSAQTEVVRLQGKLQEQETELVELQEDLAVAKRTNLSSTNTEEIEEELRRAKEDLEIKETTLRESNLQDSLFREQFEKKCTEMARLCQQKTDECEQHKKEAEEMSKKLHDLQATAEKHTAELTEQKQLLKEQHRKRSALEADLDCLKRNLETVRQQKMNADGENKKLKTDLANASLENKQLKTLNSFNLFAAMHNNK